MYGTFLRDTQSIPESGLSCISIKDLDTSILFRRSNV